MTISIDFDGTIVTHMYPEIGLLLPYAKEIINTLYEEGHTIIINTCRAGKFEGDAEAFLIENEINFHWINCNTPEKITEFKQDCRKISADIYIDDKNLGGIPSWPDIYNIIKSYEGASVALQSK